MDVRIRLFLRIIEERAGDCETALRTTSKLLGISPARLRRLFKQQTGKDLSQYVRESRMAHAAELLEEQSQEIKEIAQQCGYSDIANFYRDFRRVYQTTPHEFRRRHLTLLVATGKAYTSQHKPINPMPIMQVDVSNISTSYIPTAT